MRLLAPAVAAGLAAGCAWLGPGSALIRDSHSLTAAQEASLAVKYADSSVRFQPSRRLLHSARSAAVVSFLVLPDSEVQVDRSRGWFGKSVTLTQWMEFPEDFTLALAGRMLELFSREFTPSGLEFRRLGELSADPAYASLPYPDRQAGREFTGPHGEKYMGTAVSAPGLKFIVPSVPAMASNVLPWRRSEVEIVERDRSPSDIFTENGWNKAFGRNLRDIAAALDVDLAFCVVNLMRQRDSRPYLDRVEVYAYSRSRSSMLGWVVLPVWAGETVTRLESGDLLEKNEDVNGFWLKIAEPYRLAVRLLARRFEGDYLTPAEVPAFPEGKAREAASSGKYGKALEYVAPAAEAGNPAAQEMLGAMYWKGQGAKQDDLEAALWTRKSAEQGNAKAECRWAAMLQAGRGASKDLAAAYKWAAAAAGRGEAACAGLRDELSPYASKGGQTDEAKGALSALEAGKPKEAFELALSAARRGDASAQAVMGRLYAEGKGVPRSLEESFQWYLKAAEQGNSEAQCRVGSMYLLGKGVPMNLGEAEAWLLRAREQGSPEAMKLLDSMRPWQELRSGVDAIPEK